MPEDPIVRTGARLSTDVLIRADGAGDDTITEAVPGPDPLLEDRDTSQPWRSHADSDALTAEAAPGEEPVELGDMTRAELDQEAADRGVDTTGAKTKTDVIAAIEAD